MNCKQKSSEYFENCRISKLTNGLSSCIFLLCTTVCTLEYGERVTLGTPDYRRLGFGSYAASSFITHLVESNTVVIASGYHLEQDKPVRILNHDGSICLLRRAVFYVIKPVTKNLTNDLITVIYHEQVNSFTNNCFLPHLITYPHPYLEFSGIPVLQTQGMFLQSQTYCFKGSDMPDPQQVFIYILILKEITPSFHSSRERIYQYVDGAILSENQLYEKGGNGGQQGQPLSLESVIE